jgi:dipeptidyl aminopeptidase/acylaminoacyl peptidase
MHDARLAGDKQRPIGCRKAHHTLSHRPEQAGAAKKERAMAVRIVLAIAIFCAAFTNICAARTLVETDYRHIVAFDEPALSPDARFAATIISRVDWNENREIYSLLIAEAGKGVVREYLTGRKGLSSPEFSSDGAELAFLANDADDRAQVYVMPASGGLPRQITHAPSDVDEFAWRPDGRAIAYTAADPQPHRVGADRFRDSFIFTTEPITARSKPQPLHVFVQTVGMTRATQLTFGQRSAFEGVELSWSPDGSHVGFTLCPTNITDDQDRSQAAAVDVATHRLTLLTSHRAWESTPLFSPDGHSFAYTYSGGDNQFSLNQLYIAPASGGDGQAPWSSLDRVYEDAAWFRDGSILAAVFDGTTISFYRERFGAPPQRLSVGDLVPGVPENTTGGATVSSLEFSIANDGAIAFIGSNAAHPSELYVRFPDGRVKALTSLNRVFADSEQLSRGVRFTYQTDLGLRADGVLYYPPGFSPQRKYPLVVFIHGGPGDPSMQIFDYWAEVMAARGWLVLRPNYRGTPNLGYAFLHPILHDPEDGPGKDIMAALDAIRARGIVDDSRLAVSGWSYGGIMTAWMISKYHVWRAAVSGASVDDWITDYGTADDSGEDRDLLHGSPFVGNEAAEWRSISAISYAGDVTTPVLILSDVGDNRDPFATSSMYWRALRDNHKDATLRVWPVDGHYPDDPVRNVDVFHYWIAFIAEHFR